MQFLLKLFKALNSTQTPWQVTFAITLGMVAGLTPLSGIQTVVIFFLAFLLKGAIHLAQVAPICCGSYVAVSRWYKCNCLVHKLIRKPAFPKV